MLKSPINGERGIFLEALEQPSTEARVALIEHATAGDPKSRNLDRSI
jgi:hypothetical protein